MTRPAAAIRGETALAKLFFMALCGAEPGPAERTEALAYWKTIVASPWRDADGYTGEYARGFFADVRSLRQSSGLHARWASRFDKDHRPQSPAAARGFITDFFHELLHIPRSYHDFFCVRLSMRPMLCTDHEIKHPISVEYWSLYITERGEGEITPLSGPPIPLPPGALALIPPGCRCVVRRNPARPDWVVNWLSFRSREEWFELIERLVAFDRPIALPISDAAVLACIEAHLRELQSTPYLRGDINERLCHNIIENLLIRLRGLFEQEYGALFSDPRIRKAIQFLLPRFREPLSLEDIAAHANLSASRLNALFRKHYGTSIIKWRDDLRLHKAGELLNHSGMPVSAVAEHVGYEDPLYFSRRFRRQFGLSPRQFRQKRRGAPAAGPAMPSAPAAPAAPSAPSTPSRPLKE